MVTEVEDNSQQTAPKRQGYFLAFSIIAVGLTVTVVFGTLSTTSDGEPEAESVLDSAFYSGYIILALGLGLLVFHMLPSHPFDTGAPQRISQPPIPGEKNFCKYCAFDGVRWTDVCPRCGRSL